MISLLQEKSSQNHLELNGLTFFSYFQYYKMVKMQKKLLVVYIIISLLIGIVLFSSLNFETLSLYPFDKLSGTKIGTSHEGITSGWSEGNYFIDEDSILHFKYKLSSQTQEPFAGVYLYRPDSIKEQFIDFSRFDILSIHLKSIKAKRIPVYLTLDYNGFTDSKKTFSWLPLFAIIEYNGEGVYEINKKDFEIPSWWLRMHGVTKEDFKAIDFSRVTYIVIQSCQALGLGSEDEIQISSISFMHDNKSKIVLYIVLLFIISGIFGVVYFMNKKKRILVPYQAFEVDEHTTDSKINKIVNYMAKNYSNPELSANDLQVELGITEREIGVLIKKHLDNSFKSYLNTMRLTEVKRLLEETDKPVSDIAYLTGYSNISHFNRVFKKEFDTTPKEYRENKRN